MIGLHKPLQNISLTKKLNQDSERGVSEWGANNLDYFISISSFQGDLDTSKDRKFKIKMWYDAYNNVIDEAEFHHVTNPLNSKKEEYSNFPAKIRGLNIIRPNLELLLGEYIKRPFAYSIVNLSEDAFSSYDEKLKSKLHENINQRWINTLNELGVDTEMESKAVELPQEIESKFSAKYKDIRASKGLKRLQAIEREKNLFKVYRDLFFDYCVAGECYSYKYVEHDDLTIERISPLDIDYGLSINKDYVEDSDWVVIRQVMSLGDILDKWYDSISKEQLTYLNEKSEDGLSNDSQQVYSRLQGEENISNSFNVYTVFWKSQKKIGYYNYIDELGQPQLEMVEEGFKIPVEQKEQGASIEWESVNEYWTGKRIDDKFYVDIKALEIQRNALDNFSYCKNPVNGCKYSQTHSSNISIVGLLMPYQIMYIIINFHIEKTIAKSKGKIALIDINVIPDTEDFDAEKTFYWAESMGYMLIDRNKVGADKSFNQYTTLDMSLYDSITQLINIKESIKQDAEELLGFNRQRKGQVHASDSVGGTERATFQSSVMSELLFTKFEDFKSVDYQAILDYIKFLYKNGKKGLHYNDDLSAEVYEIEAGDLMESELGIKIVNNTKDIDELNKLKSFAHAFAQNGSSPSTVAEVIRANSVIDLQSKLKEIEKVQADMDNQAAKSEQEAAAALDERKKEFQKYSTDLAMVVDNNNHDRLDNREYIKGEIQNALVPVEGDSKDLTDVEVEGITDSIERRSMERERGDLEARKVELDAIAKGKEHSLKKEDLRIKEKAVDTGLKIAKENKNKYDSKSA